jgi:hypothetical protein
VKTIPKSRGNKKKYFAKPQKVCRKDVEHTFDVLQSHFAIVHGSARLWDEDSLKNIMMVCIIMYNMIVKDEAEEDNDFNYNQMGERVILSHDNAPELDAFIANYRKIKNKKTHLQLQKDLIEHL